MKRYSMAGTQENINDSDTFWGCFLKAPLNKDNVIYDRKLHAMSIKALTKYNPTELDLIIADRYPTAMIPIPEDIRFIDIFGVQIAGVSVIQIFDINKGWLINYIKNTYAKHSDEIYLLSKQYKNVFEKFKDSGLNDVEPYNKLVKEVFDLLHIDYKDIKTYDVKETRGKETQTTTYTTAVDSNTQKTANTPETIPNQSVDQTIENFISAISKIDGSRTTDGTLSELEDKTFEKIGNIKVDKNKEHYILEVFDKMKSDFYKILDKIVDSIAITFNLGD